MRNGGESENLYQVSVQPWLHAIQMLRGKSMKRHAVIYRNMWSDGGSHTLIAVLELLNHLTH